MNKIGLLLKGKNKIVLIFILVGAIALPVIISQVLRQQDTRQRASGAQPASFSLSPAQKSATVDENFDVSVVIDTSTTATENDIGAVKVKLQYDNSKLEVLDVKGENGMQIIKEVDNAGLLDVTVVNPTATPVSGNAVNVITATFKAKGFGTTEVSYASSGLEATATGSKVLVAFPQPTSKSTITISDGETTGDGVTATVLTPDPLYSTFATLKSNITKPATSVVNAKYRYDVRTGNENKSCAQLQRVSSDIQFPTGQSTFNGNDRNVSDLTAATAYRYCLEYTVTPAGGAAGTPKYSNIIEFTTSGSTVNPTATQVSSMSLGFSPDTGTYSVGEEVITKMIINQLTTGVTNNIERVKISMNFPASSYNAADISFTKSNRFDQVISPPTVTSDATKHTLAFELKRTAPADNTGPIEIGTLRLKAKTAVDEYLAYSTREIYAFNRGVPLTISNTMPLHFIYIPTNDCNALTGRPNDCVCQNSPQCASGSCRAASSSTTTTCQPPITNSCPLRPKGDADCNGKVDIFDFIIWKGEYVTAVTPARADFDGSGAVNYEDFEDWKSGYRDSSVPH